jgi:hypothetical protein
MVACKRLTPLPEDTHIDLLEGRIAKHTGIPIRSSPVILAMRVKPILEEYD